MKEYKIIRTNRSWKDLAEIFDSILEVSFSIASAKKWVERIDARIHDLRLLPEGRPAFRGSTTIRSTNVGKYKIIYEVDTKSSTIAILRIVYARRNLLGLTLK